MHGYVAVFGNAAFLIRALRRRSNAVRAEILNKHGSRLLEPSVAVDTISVRLTTLGVVSCEIRENK